MQRILFQSQILSKLGSSVSITSISCGGKHNGPVFTTCWWQSQVHGPDFLPGKSRRDQHLSPLRPQCRFELWPDLCCLLLDRSVLPTTSPQTFIQTVLETDNGSLRQLIYSSVVPADGWMINYWSSEAFFTPVKLSVSTHCVRARIKWRNPLTDGVWSI